MIFRGPTACKRLDSADWIPFSLVLPVEGSVGKQENKSQSCFTGAMMSLGQAL